MNTKPDRVIVVDDDPELRAKVGEENINRFRRAGV
jgi:hypothetical protein